MHTSRVCSDCKISGKAHETRSLQQGSCYKQTRVSIVEKHFHWGMLNYLSTIWKSSSVILGFIFLVSFIYKYINQGCYRSENGQGKNFFKAREKSAKIEINLHCWFITIEGWKKRFNLVLRVLSSRDRERTLGTRLETFGVYLVRENLIFIREKAGNFEK